MGIEFVNDCIIPVDTSCRPSMCARCDRRGVRMRRIPGMAALGRVGRSRSWLVGRPPSPERDIKGREKSHAWVLDEDAIQSTFDRSTRCPWRYRHGPVMRLSESCGWVGDGEGGGTMSDTRFTGSARVEIPARKNQPGKGPARDKKMKTWYQKSG